MIAVPSAASGISRRAVAWAAQKPHASASRARESGSVTCSARTAAEMPERHVAEAPADGAARLGARLEEAVIPVPAHGPSRVARYSRMSGRVSGVIGAP